MVLNIQKCLIQPLDWEVLYAVGTSLKKEKKLTARQRYYKQAKTEKKPKIQAIHNEDEMNSIV